MFGTVTLASGRRQAFRPIRRHFPLEPRAGIPVESPVNPLETLAILLLAGAFTGWLGAMTTGGEGYGLKGDTALGALGGVLAGWFMPYWLFDLGHSAFALAATAMIGAIILVSIGRRVHSA